MTHADLQKSPLWRALDYQTPEAVAEDGAHWGGREREREREVDRRQHLANTPEDVSSHPSSGLELKVTQL